jgi:hypothetical protein
MSKKIKQKNRLDRLQAKRARKAANQARYAEMKRQGINGKSKRAKANAKKRKRYSGISHPNGACGNIGCKKCFPEYYEIGLEFQANMKAKHNLPTRIIVDEKGMTFLAEKNNLKPYKPIWHSQQKMSAKNFNNEPKS